MNINLTILGQIIAFAMFVWFCMKYVWPPIMTAIDERATRIADGLSAAEKGHHELTQAEARAKELADEGRSQAQEYIAQAQRRADEMIEEAKGDARSEGDRLLVAARAEIDQERNQAREKLRGEVSALALTAAGQILMREVDVAEHREVLDRISAQL